MFRMEKTIRKRIKTPIGACKCICLGENEAVDDPNDNSLEFDDEGGNLLESNDMDVDEDPMEDVVAPKGKRKARGKDIDWIFHESFEDNTSFVASEFHKGFLDQFSIKTKNEHLYGEVSVYICKYARKRHFENGKSA